VPGRRSLTLPTICATSWAVRSAKFPRFPGESRGPYCCRNRVLKQWQHLAELEGFVLRAQWLPAFRSCKEIDDQLDQRLCVLRDGRYAASSG
jgi:hypothetical protein